jgi:hypothetical protein
VLSKDWHDIVSRIEPLSKMRATKVWHYCGMATTIVFLFIAGTVFRADSLPNTFLILQKAVTLAPSGELTRQFMQSTVLVSLSVYMIFLFWRSWMAADRSSLVPPAILRLIDWWNDSLHVRAVAYAAIAFVIMGFAPGKITPFIYFQF